MRKGADATLPAAPRARALMGQLLQALCALGRLLARWDEPLLLELHAGLVDLCMGEPWGGAGRGVRGVGSGRWVG